MAGQLTIEQRKQIIVLYQSGCNVREIQRRTGTTRKTIRYWLRRHMESGDLTSHRRQHYPRSTTAEQDAAIIAAHREHPCLTTTMTAIQHNISTETVRRRLKEGLKPRIPTKNICNEGPTRAICEKAGTSVEEIERSLNKNLRKKVKKAQKSLKTEQSRRKVNDPLKVEVSMEEFEETSNEAEDTFEEDEAYFEEAEIPLENTEVSLEKAKESLYKAHLKEAEETAEVAENCFEVKIEVLLEEAKEEELTLKKASNSVEKAKLPLVDVEECKESDIKDLESKSKTHCVVCSKIPEYVCGYRYVCIECKDSEICETCYLDGHHSLHYVLRIPIHKPWKEVKSVLKNLQEQLLEIKDDEMELKHDETSKPQSSNEDLRQTIVNEEATNKQNISNDEQEVGYNIIPNLEPDPLMTDTMIEIQIPEAMQEVTYSTEKLKAIRENAHFSRIKSTLPRALPKGTHPQNQNKPFTLLHALLLNTNNKKRTFTDVDIESEPRNKTSCFNKKITKDNTASEQKVIKSESAHCAHSVERELCVYMSCRTKR